MEEDPKKPEEITQETSISTDAENVPVAPKKKRRWLKRIAIVLGILISLVILFVAFCLGPVVKFVANNYGANFLGVDKCEIGDAAIYPFVGHVRFEKILIGKPIPSGANFSYNLFSVELIDVDVDMLSLLSQKKIIDRLEVQNLSANYEQLMNGDANVNAIIKKVAGEEKAEEVREKAADAKIPEPSEKPSDDAEEIFIGARYLVITDVNVAAYIRGMPIILPPLNADFSNGIGMDDDLTPVQFGMKVGGNVLSMIDSIRKSALGDAAGAAMGAVSDAAAITGDAAKATLNLTTGAVSDAANLTGDAISGAATFTGDAAKVTADIVGDAAELTGDAAKATADAVADTADAIFDIFKKKDDKKSDK